MSSCLWGMGQLRRESRALMCCPAAHPPAAPTADRQHVQQAADAVRVHRRHRGLHCHSAGLAPQLPDQVRLRWRVVAEAAQPPAWGRACLGSGAQLEGGQHASVPSQQPTCAAPRPRRALQLDLLLTAFSASVALITAITGLFAMNVMLQPDTVRRSVGAQPLHGRGLVLRTGVAAGMPLTTAPRGCPSAAPSPSQVGQAPNSWFLAISISTGVGAIVLFAGTLAYCRWQRLI